MASTYVAGTHSMAFVTVPDDQMARKLAKYILYSLWFFILCSLSIQYLEIVGCAQWTVFIKIQCSFWIFNTLFHSSSDFILANWINLSFFTIVWRQMTRCLPSHLSPHSFILFTVYTDELFNVSFCSYFILILTYYLRSSNISHVVVTYNTLDFSLTINTSNYYLPLTFWPLPEIFIRRSYFNSSSGSCHGRVVTWQEIGCTCGWFLAMSQLFRGKNWKKNWINFFWWIRPITISSVWYNGFVNYLTNVSE